MVGTHRSEAAGWVRLWEGGCLPCPELLGGGLGLPRNAAATRRPLPCWHYWVRLLMPAASLHWGRNHPWEVPQDVSSQPWATAFGAFDEVCTHYRTHCPAGWSQICDQTHSLLRGTGISILEE